MNDAEEEKKPAPVDLEGGGWNWWYVCSECHTYLNSNDKVCRGCHRPIIWAGPLLTRRKVYTGEQTEPAE